MFSKRFYRSFLESRQLSWASVIFGAGNAGLGLAVLEVFAKICAKIGRLPANYLAKSVQTIEYTMRWLWLAVRIVAIALRLVCRFGDRWLDEHDVFNHLNCIVEARLIQVAPKMNYKLNYV